MFKNADYTRIREKGAELSLTNYQSCCRSSGAMDTNSMFDNFHKTNKVFATNLNFLILISLLPDVVDIGYFNL